MYFFTYSKVLIEERDEYLSQTIYEVARVVSHCNFNNRINRNIVNNSLDSNIHSMKNNGEDSSKDSNINVNSNTNSNTNSSNINININNKTNRIRILAVVGGGHLAGIQKYLKQGGVSDAKITGK